jgi:dipeptidase E
MVASPNFGEGYYDRDTPTGISDSPLGLVEFSLLPHLDHERFPENSLANLERVAARIPVPTYAIDDQTAIKVTEGTVEIVSEGHWKLFTP